MDKFVIQGGQRLAGRIRVEGAKNATLPLMATSLLTSEEVTLTNVASLADVVSMRKLLNTLGVEIHLGDERISMQTKDPNAIEAPYEQVRTMRASICILVQARHKPLPWFVHTYELCESIGHRHHGKTGRIQVANSLGMR